MQGTAGGVPMRMPLHMAICGSRQAMVAMMTRCAWLHPSHSDMGTCALRLGKHVLTTNQHDIRMLYRPNLVMPIGHINTVIRASQNVHVNLHTKVKSVHLQLLSCWKLLSTIDTPL